MSPATLELHMVFARALTQFCRGYSAWVDSQRMEMSRNLGDKPSNKLQKKADERGQGSAHS